MGVQKTKRTKCICKRLYLESSTSICENGEYLASPIDDSVITMMKL